MIQTSKFLDQNVSMQPDRPRNELIANAWRLLVANIIAVMAFEEKAKRFGEQYFSFPT